MSIASAAVTLVLIESTTPCKGLLGLAVRLFRTCNGTEAVKWRGHMLYGQHKYAQVVRTGLMPQANADST